MYNTLGKFTSEYKIAGIELAIRGLTVGEFFDLSMSYNLNTLAFMPRAFVEIAHAGIIGWDLDQEFDLELLDEHLEIEDFIAIGKCILQEHTLLPEEVEEKLKGYTRFTHFLSEDKHRGMSDTFNCENCVRRGSVRNRLCGKYTPEEIDRLTGVTAAEKKAPVSRSKYKVNKRRFRKKKNNEVSGKVFKFAEFAFPECPVSWLDEWIWNAGQVLYHAEKSNIPLFSGGLLDQPYKLYRAARVIGAESNKIENERMKKESQKARR